MSGLRHVVMEETEVEIQELGDQMSAVGCM